MRKTARTKTPRPAAKARSRSSATGNARAGIAATDPREVIAIDRIARDPVLQARMFTAATAYLKANQKQLNVPVPWVTDTEKAIGSDSNRLGAHLRWLPCEWVTAGPSRTLVRRQNSYAYVRTGAGGETSVMMVLFATLFWRDPESAAEQPLWGGQGVRVIARMMPSLRPVVVAASTSLPAVIANDVEVWNRSLVGTDVAHLFGDEFAARLPHAAGLDPVRYGTNTVGVCLDEAIATANGLAWGTRLTARLVPAATSGSKAAPTHDPDAPAYAVEAEIKSGGGKPPQLAAIRRYPLFAQLKAHVYRQDPPTRSGAIVLANDRPAGMRSGRPNRSRLDLDHFRATFDVRALPSAGAGQVKLEDPKHRFFVAQSRHVEGGSAGFNENAPVAISTAPADSARTDRFAAVNAYLRALDFFARLDDLYGLPMAVHFAYARLPIIVRYRAGVVPGAGDGRTINAQVRWAPTNPPTAFPANLEVRLALADLQSNEGRVNSARRTGKVRRAPLSIAAAPRWCWHEFGHVLIAGATGALELEFAHSVGDALGAILSDPDSRLADEGAWRGVTFPFQSLPNRRHDHTPGDGWSWSGSLARPTRFFAGVGGRHALNRGGYCSEQIMSSTLFNLYRSLGGDARTAAGKRDEWLRRVAAEHTVALIMAGVGLFGHYSTSTVRTVKEFADTLMAAESAMLPLKINARTRYGGMAGKVIRWAFERQGAFPPPGTPDWTHNAPGAAPEVDVFVASRRAGERGGYEAVTFADEGQRAAPDALWVRRRASGTPDQPPLAGQDNFVYVKVGNRGQSDANDTTVRVWRAKLGPGGAIPRWTASAWVPLASATGAGPKNVPAGTAGVRFGPFRWPVAAKGDYALLAEANASKDPSNVDMTNPLPCAMARCNVDELVAFDNNLGLRVVTAV